MLSLLKKNAERAKAAQVPAWHTNFRNFAALPDTKVIRTSFFVNGILVILAAVATLAFVYQEISLSELKTQLKATQDRIDNSRGQSEKAVQQYKTFQSESQKVADLDAFIKSQKAIVSELIIRLAENRPPLIVFLTISYNEGGLNIKGYAQGISEQATSAASAYEKSLKDDPALSSLFKTIAMTNVSRDVQGNRLMFDIVMDFGKAKGK